MSKKTIIRLTSLGGIPPSKESGNIMGSCYIVRVEKNVKQTKKELIFMFDCGSLGDNNQAHKQIDTILESIGGDVSKISGLLLSHTHLDHGGYIPALVGHGRYRGPIYMSHDSKTKFIVVMKDSLSISQREQELAISHIKKLGTLLHSDLRIVEQASKIQGNGKSNGIGNGDKKTFNKHAKEKGKRIIDDGNIEESKERIKKYNITCNADIARVLENFSIPELPFTEKDIHQAVSQIVACDWMKEKKLVEDSGITVYTKFYPAGHLQGAAQIVLTIKPDSYNKNNKFSIGFHGDLGRSKEPILLPKPSIIKEPLDCSILESTYGNKIHPKRSPELDHFCDEINSATSAVIIPSFSDGRSADIAYLLHQFASGKITLGPNEKIYIHGKLTKEIMEIYLTRYPETYGFLTSERFVFIDSNQQRKEIIAQKGRKIIITSGGMLQGGTSPERVKKYMHDPKTKVLLVGYQPPGTRGHYLENNQGWVYDFESFNKNKHRMYSPEHTIKKIEKRGKQSVYISCSSTKELEKIMIDLYQKRQKIIHNKGEKLYIPGEYRDDEPVYDKHDKRRMILKTGTNLKDNHPDIFAYRKNKIEIIDNEEAYDEQENFIGNMPGIVIYRDRKGKQNLKAKIIKYNSFGGHGDSEELVEIMEKTTQKKGHITVLVHGEDLARRTLGSNLQNNKYITTKVVIPQLFKTLTLNR